MATLPAPDVQEFPEDSLEKKVYTLIDSFEKNIPLMNDRNRLAFALLNYLNGHGDEPAISVRNNKLTLKDISESELSKLIEAKISGLQKS